jgi:hypothetical protein
MCVCDRRSVLLLFPLLAHLRAWLQLLRSLRCPGISSTLQVRHCGTQQPPWQTCTADASSLPRTCTCTHTHVRTCTCTHVHTCTHPQSATHTHDMHVDAGNTYVLWIGAASSSSRAQATLINAVNALFGAGSLAAPLLAELCRVRGVYPPPAGAGGASVDADVRQLDAYWLAAALTAVSACCFLVLPSPSPPGTTTSGSSSRCAADSAVVDDALTAESSSGDGALGTASSVTAAAVAAQTGASAGRWRTTLLCCIALFQYLNVGTEVAFGAQIAASIATTLNAPSRHSST